MSRHRLVRNLDYEAELNDYDEFEEEEDELSPEDRALMTQGTVDVRTALGTESSKVTTEQIEEALWHYYYDVDKSVAYLVSKFISPPPPKASKPKPPTQKPNSKSLVPPVALATTVEKLSSWAENHLVGTGDEYGYTPATGPPFLAQTPSSENKESLAHWFADMPWGNIPQHRQTVFIPPPKPKGGLLGGSGAPPKMSKLQALAAARKKKLEEKESSEEQVENARTKMTDLSVSGDAPMGKENNPLAGAYSKRLKTSSSTAQGRNPIIQTEARSEPPPQSIKQPEVSESSKPTPVDHAQPSAFAQTLFGSFPNTHKPERQNLVTLSLAPSVFEAFSKPSPDDIVLAAQAKATKKAPAAKTKKSTSSAADEAAGELKQLKVDDSPLPRSQDLDVLSEYEKAKSKRNASFVVVGHVDAGKSTMMGRLLLDLNVIDQRTVEKLRKEAQSIGKSSFALAWVLDQRSEERSRGVTIDIATNRFETEKTAFTILDAPGHRDFIPNMIAGASQADFAILVIDASTGAFESGLKGQTREHSLLIRSMGVSRIIVAVNKLDTVDWSKDRFDEIKDQVSGFLSTTGFQVKNIAFVPVSGLNGDNLVKRSQDLAASWYKGATLIEELENSEPNARALAKPLRITISEVFRTQQSQVTISGRVDAGSFQIGDALIVQPSSEKAYVKSLTVDEAPANWAVAGQNVVVALSQIDPIHVRVGDIICHPANPIPKDKKFTMKALAFDFLMPMQVDVHRGRLHAAGRITAMPALLDKVTGSVTKKNPKLIKPGTVARITVELESVVPMEAGQRVVLRSGGETIAAGLLE